MPSYSELKKTNRFYYFIKFTLNVYSMLFSVSFFGLYISISILFTVVGSTKSQQCLLFVADVNRPNKMSFKMLAFICTSCSRHIHTLERMFSGIL